MRRAFVVLLLLSVMLGLKVLGAGGEHARSMTLAAIGFVVLAAFAVAELGSRWKLPKVTGYIVAGAVLGPFAIGVLSREVVEDLSMFNTLAVGLIATTAGLELHISSIRRVFKTLMATIAAKLVLASGAVFVFVLLVAPETNLDLVEGGAMALALVMGAVAIGTSPAVTLAVIEETRSKGRLSDLILAAAVFKDVVVVVALALALAVAKSAVGGGEFSAGALLHVGQEILTSMFAGGILGVILILYMRILGAEMLLFVAAMVLVVAEISAALHLELLLVFITAGFVVSNFSKREHQLLEPLQRVSLPVFVIFFTNAGASVDLQAAWAVLPLALGVCVVRAVAYVASGALGGRIGDEEPAVRNWASAAYIPQAGVALGLIGLAAEALPTLREPVWNLGMAVVALNLLVGPVLQRVALNKAGESADASAASAAPEEMGERPGLSSELEAQLRGVQRAVGRAFARLESRTLRPVLREQTRQLQARIEDKGLQELPELEPETLATLERGFESCYASVRDELRRLPVSRVVPLSRDELQARDDDEFLVRLGLRIRRLAWWIPGRARRRRVPVRLAARFVVKPLIAQAIVEAGRNYMRIRARAYEELRRLARHTVDPATARESLKSLEDHLLARQARVRQDLERRIDFELGTAFADLDGPRRRLRSIRFSRVHGRVEESMQAMRDELDAWAEREAGLRGAVEYTRAGSSLLLEVEQKLVTEFGGRIDKAHQAQIEELEAALERLAPLRADLESGGEVDFDGIAVRFAALVPKPAQKRMGNLEQRLQGPAARQAIESRARTVVGSMTRQGTATTSADRLSEAPKPASAPVSSLDMQGVFERVFLAHMMPAVEEAISKAANSISQVARDWRDVVRALTVTADLGQAEQSDQERMAHLYGASERAAAGLSAAIERAKREYEELHEVLVHVVEHSRDELSEALSYAGGEGRRRRAASGTLAERVAQRRDQARKWFAVLRERVVRLFSDGTTGAWAQQYRMRGSSGEIDPRAIRRYLELRDDVEVSELPGVLDRLFDGSAVTDPRLFVLHEDELQRIVSAERAWARGKGSGDTAVIGGTGSGKTSLLSIARLRISSRRVVFLRPGGRYRGSSLWAALAKELGVAPERVEETLMREKGAVLIDDLHAWFPPTSEGIRELSRYADLIAATHRSTFWIVTLDHAMVSALAGAHSLMTVFENVISLAPASPADLERAVLARHETAGVDLEIDATGVSRLLLNFGPRFAQRALMQLLATTSHGSLRSAHRLWRAHLQVDGDGRAHSRGLRVLEAALPFVRTFDATTVAVLVLLARHGSLSAGQLATAAGEPEPEVHRRLVKLEGATLVVEEDRGWALEPSLRDDLYAALVEIGALEAAG